MDEPIYSVIIKVQFDIALEVWFSIYFFSFSHVLGSNLARLFVSASRTSNIDCLD